jgi:hypothetical protein
MVRDQQFDAAFSTAWGAGTPDGDRHQLPRFTPWDALGARYAMRMAQNLTRRAQATA